MKRILLTLALALSCLGAQAQPTSLPGYYGPSEFVLGLSSTWTTPASDFDITKGTVGITVNGTKFFNQYAGATAEIGVVDLYNVGNLVIDQVSLGATLRYPINRVAPFVRVLVGRDFNQGLYTFDTGAGLEYRLTRNLGAFVEGRYRFRIDNSDKVTFTGGVTLAF